MSAAPEEAPGSRRSWEAAWAERETLLKIARRRSASAADAEDVVSEAITRSAESPDVDHDRVGPWLSAVTTRLCVDDARDRARDGKRIAYQVRQGTTTEDHGDVVCDRAEARWLASRVAALPERQSRALELRARGLEVAGIAEAMGISDKAVEGLLKRARTALRDALSSALGWLGLVLAAVIGLTRRRGATSAAVVAAAGLSTVLAVVHLPTPPAQAGPERGSGAAVPAPAAEGSASDDRVLRAPTTGPAPRRAEQRTVPRAPRSAPAARPSAAPAPQATRQAVVEPADVEVGGVYSKGGDITSNETSESFPDAVQRCLREGPAVSPTFVGCRPSDEPG